MRKSYLYYIITVILSFCMMAVSVLAKDRSLGLRTVVIDPGHGGKDPGGVSRDKRLSRRILSWIYPSVSVRRSRRSIRK